MTRLFHSLFLLLLLVAAGLLVPASEAATLRLGGALAQPGQQNVPVALTLEPGAGEAVAALQCDVPIDSAVFVQVQVTAGPTAVAASKQVVLSQPQPGRWRIIVSGFNQNAIGAGVVATLLLHISPSAAERAYLLPPEGVVLSSPEGQRVPGTTHNGAVYVGAGRFHSADYTQNNKIFLGELLRVIQFFNTGALHCDSAGEDGYAPGPGPQDCHHHDSDYLEPRDWRISLSELLRIIQFFNSGGYVIAPASEDGFAPDTGKTAVAP
jgi:hypothetical protein